MASSIKKNLKSNVPKKLWTIGSVKRIAMQFAKRRIQDFAQQTRIDNLGPLRVLTSIMKDCVEESPEPKPLEIESQGIESNLVREIAKIARENVDCTKKPTFKIYSSKQSITKSSPSFSSQCSARRQKIKRRTNRLFQGSKRRKVDELNLHPAKRVPDASSLLNFYLNEAHGRYDQLLLRLNEKPAIAKSVDETTAIPKVSADKVSLETAPKRKGLVENMKTTSGIGSRKATTVLPHFGHFAHKLPRNIPIFQRPGPLVSMFLRKGPVIPRSGPFILKSHNNYAVVPRYGPFQAKMAKRVPISSRPSSKSLVTKVAKKVSVPPPPRAVLPKVVPKVVKRVPVPPCSDQILHNVTNRVPVPPRRSNVFLKSANNTNNIRRSNTAVNFTGYNKPQAKRSATNTKSDPTKIVMNQIKKPTVNKTPIPRLDSITKRFSRSNTVGTFLGLNKTQDKNTATNVKFDRTNIVMDKIKEQNARNSRISAVPRFDSIVPKKQHFHTVDSHVGFNKPQAKRTDTRINLNPTKTVMKNIREPMVRSKSVIPRFDSIVPRKQYSNTVDSNVGFKKPQVQRTDPKVKSDPAKIVMDNNKRQTARSISAIPRLESNVPKKQHFNTVDSYDGFKKPQVKRTETKIKLDTTKIVMDKIKEHTARGSVGCVVRKASLNVKPGLLTNIKNPLKKVRKFVPHGENHGGTISDMFSEWKGPNASKKGTTNNKKIFGTASNMAYNSQTTAQRHTAGASPGQANERKTAPSGISDKGIPKSATQNVPTAASPMATYGNNQKINFWKKPNNPMVSQGADYTRITSQSNAAGASSGLASERKMASGGTFYKTTQQTSSTSPPKQKPLTDISGGNQKNQMGKIRNGPPGCDSVGVPKTITDGYAAGVSSGKTSDRKVVSSDKQQSDKIATTKAIPSMAMSDGNNRIAYGKIRTAPKGCEVTDPKTTVQERSAGASSGLTSALCMASGTIPHKGGQKSAKLPMDTSGGSNKMAPPKIRTGPPGCDDDCDLKTQAQGHAARASPGLASERCLASGGISVKDSKKAATPPKTTPTDSEKKAYVKIRTGPPGCEIAEPQAVSPGHATGGKRKPLAATASATALIIERNSITLSGKSRSDLTTTNDKWKGAQKDIAFSSLRSASPIKSEIKDKFTNNTNKAMEEKKGTDLPCCDSVGASHVKTERSANSERKQSVSRGINANREGSAAETYELNTERVMTRTNPRKPPSLASQKCPRPTATSMVAPLCVPKPESDSNNFNPIKYVHGKIKKIF